MEITKKEVKDWITYYEDAKSGKSKNYIAVKLAAVIERFDIEDSKKGFDLAEFQKEMQHIRGISFDYEEIDAEIYEQYEESELQGSFFVSVEGLLDKTSDYVFYSFVQENKQQFLHYAKKSQQYLFDVSQGKEEGDSQYTPSMMVLFFSLLIFSKVLHKYKDVLKKKDYSLGEPVKVKSKNLTFQEAQVQKSIEEFINPIIEKQNGK